jgi:hypothetical protein
MLESIFIRTWDGSQTMIATAGRHIYGSYLLSKGVDI